MKGFGELTDEFWLGTIYKKHGYTVCIYIKAALN